MSRLPRLATGVAADGRREVPGFDVGDTENEPFWTAFLWSLKTRGLTGVKLVMSDAHTGWKKAIGTVFQGAARQRCRVHYADVAGGARIQSGYRPIDVGISRSVGHA